MHEEGYEIVIWTARGGKNLEGCMSYLRKLGLNQKIKFNTHSEYFLKKFSVQSPKIGASVYIDDRGYNAPDFSKYWFVIEKEFL